MRRTTREAKRVAIFFSAACLAAIIPLNAFASKYNDCKEAALTHYSAAVLTSNIDDAKKAIIESTACKRFISDLPKEEQDKVNNFQEEMYKFQIEQQKS
jgi:hypothetical protein